MLGSNFVSFYLLAFRIQINGVESQLLLTGNQFVCEFKVFSQFSDGACLAGIVTGGLDTAGQGTHALEAVDVVGLPAVHGDADVLHLSQSCLGVHTDLGIHFLGGKITLVLIHVYVPP